MINHGVSEIIRQPLESENKKSREQQVSPNDCETN